MCTLANLLGGTLYLALSFSNSGVPLAHLARASDFDLLCARAIGYELRET